MELYGAIDLHSRNNFTAIVNTNKEVVFKRKLRNDLEEVKAALAPFQGSLKGVVVESTYNWYWLVDGLLEAGYQVKLANPSAIKQYEGLKHTDDESDAVFLGNMYQLGILPEGYIYPKDGRMLRDLFRQRCRLAQEKTANLTSVQNNILRNINVKMKGRDIEKLKAADVKKMFSDKNLQLAIWANIKVIRSLQEQINAIEKWVRGQTKPQPESQKLMTVPGIGDILAMTIMLETGDIGRFKAVGNYVSYCRLVKSERLSAGKKKGKGNIKNGNRWLSWAYIEAAHFAIRYYKEIEKYYQKKAAKTNEIVAKKTIAHKLARASYYIIKDNVEFDMKKCFG